MEIKNCNNITFGTKISGDLQCRLLSEATKVRGKSLPDDISKRLFMLEKSAGDISELVFRKFDGIEYFFLDTKVGDKIFSTKVSQSKKINILAKFLSISPKALLDAEINNIKHLTRKNIRSN